jgi:hypothetical protein
MGLTVGQRRAVTKAIATRYKRADKAARGVILDELCATTGWHRSHARKALGQALTPPVVVRARTARAPRYGSDVITALALCWAVLGAPAGKRLAPMMAELVPRLRRFEELSVSDEVATALVRCRRRRWTAASRRTGPRCSCAAAATPSPARC